MSEKFTVTWEAADGYVGGARPHTFTISDQSINEDMTEDELRELFDEEVQEDFNQNVSYSTDDEAAFVAWAKEVQSRMKGDGV